MVPHLGGIFFGVKSLRSRAQGPKISRFAPGPGPQGPKKNQIIKPIEKNKAPPSAAPPRGARFARPPLGFVVFVFLVDFLHFFVDDFCGKICPEKKNVLEKTEDPSRILQFASLTISSFVGDFLCIIFNLSVLSSLRNGCLVP